MIEKTDPDGIMLKFMTGEIKEKKSLRNDYNLLLLKLGEIASALEIPLFYLNGHNEGFSSHLKGISIFVEFMKHHYNLHKATQMSNIQLERLKKNNPNFLSGKIYDPKKRTFVSRKEFISHFEIQQNNKKNNTQDLNSMSDRSFRDYAKWILMEARNKEEEDLHAVIKKDKKLI
jgi:hypothetical protein